MAKEAASLLAKTYPGHPWHVGVGNGVLTIKHMRMSSKWAMVLHYTKVAQDFSILRRGIVFSAGEMLERAKLARGQDSGDRIDSVDGMPMKDLLVT